MFSLVPLILFVNPKTPLDILRYRSCAYPVIHARAWGVDKGRGILRLDDLTPFLKKLTSLLKFWWPPGEKNPGMLLPSRVSQQGSLTGLSTEYFVSHWGSVTEFSLLVVLLFFLIMRNTIAKLYWETLLRNAMVNRISTWTVPLCSCMFLKKSVPSLPINPS